MRRSEDFDLYERHIEALVLTRTSVFVCVFIFLYLFTSSVSHALCLDKVDLDFPTFSLQYSDVGQFKFNEKDAVGWNTKGAKHLAKYLYDRNGQGKNEDIKEAKRSFREAITRKKEYSPALNNLGIIYWNGWGGDKDTEKAKEYFGIASGYGYTPARNNFGVTELRESLKSLDTWDPESKVGRRIQGAVSQIEKAAEDGYPPALNNLGILYLKKQNYTEAFEYFKRASDSNYAAALFNLGFSYAQGYGVERDYGEAANLYEKAALGGNVNAQYSLGLMYSQGVGVGKNLVNSFIWLGVAKERGSDEAEKAQSVVEELLTKEQISEATSCVKDISQRIHVMDPFTLYDWEQQYNWMSTYYRN